MMTVSGFFGGRAPGNGVPPQLRYGGRSGSYEHVSSVRDPNTGQFVPQRTSIPFGTKAAFDYGAAERGPLSYKPYDDSHMVPIHVDVPPIPGPDYTLAVRVPVLLPRFGLVQLTLGGTIAQNALWRTYQHYLHAREATEGRIPVVELQASKQISLASRNGELHWQPVFEVVGWIDRPEDQFGPRRVPPPPPILDKPQATPALPSSMPQVTEQKRVDNVSSPSEDAPGAAAADALFASMTPTTPSPGHPRF